MVVTEKTFTEAQLIECDKFNNAIDDIRKDYMKICLTWKGVASLMSEARNIKEKLQNEDCRVQLGIFNMAALTVNSIKDGTLSGMEQPLLDRMNLIELNIAQLSRGISGYISYVDTKHYILFKEFHDRNRNGMEAFVTVINVLLDELIYNLNR